MLVQLRLLSNFKISTKPNHVHRVSSVSAAQKGLVQGQSELVCSRTRDARRQTVAAPHDPTTVVPRPSFVHAHTIRPPGDAHTRQAPAYHATSHNLSNRHLYGIIQYMCMNDITHLDSPHRNLSKNEKKTPEKSTTPPHTHNEPSRQHCNNRAHVEYASNVLATSHRLQLLY